MGLTRTELVQCLEDRGFAFQALDLGNGLTLVATTAGGRIFGPFIGETDPLGWTPERTAFEVALATSGWNIGGERVWLAPERAFNFSDPAAMLETYRVDTALDPGGWKMSGNAREINLSASMNLPRSDDGSRVEVTVTRRVQPLEAAKTAAAGLICGGYRQEIAVACGPRADGLAVVPWLIRQVVPGGRASLSSRGVSPGEPVFGVAPTEALVPEGREWKVAFGPSGFFKTSYAREAIGSGNLSYTATVSGMTSLLQYHPELAAPTLYPETLPRDNSGPGQAAALFFDDGRFGAFGEVELYGHRSGPDRGRLSANTLFMHGADAAVAGVWSI